ncbi:MAG: polyprenyl synthetase family protein [Alphaproteobacteria bacterium]|nr:polyprenyl synthetase family protein [Alphaproteobacteria bacterium]
MLAFAPASAAPAPLSAALTLAGADLHRVDALILKRVSTEIPMIREVARHIIASGGKRLRPLLTLLSAQACGYHGDRHITLASAIEFIHTATLLHDDVVDESRLRRGIATANAVFGNKASVLVGDFLLSQAFALVVEDGSPACLRILSDAASTIARGEVKQLTIEGDLETSNERYLDVIACKTAALFAAACELGAVTVESARWREPLRVYGQALGTAFQLVDDALDYHADQFQLGKEVGDDFREGKITLPVILAYRRATASEKVFWIKTLQERRQEEGDLAQAIALLRRHGALEATLAEARNFCARAAGALSPLPESPHKAALLEIVDFCVERGY